MFIHFDVGMGVESHALGKERYRRKRDRSSLVLRASCSTNKLELLKWAREVKQCEWDEETINVAALKGNLEMLKYCFSNDCPCDEEESCKQAAMEDTSTVFDFFSTK